MLLPQYKEFLLIIASCYLLSPSSAQDCTGKQSRQAKLDTWDKFDIAFQEQITVQVSIPVGYLQNMKDEIEKDNTFVKQLYMSSFNSTPFHWRVLNHFKRFKWSFNWRVSISIDAATIDNPVLVLVKDGRTEKSFRMPYTRTKNRSKTAITVPFSARSMDLCPIEEITQDSLLNIKLFSSSNITVEAKLKVELSTPWLNWKEIPEEKKFETLANLSLSSPIVKKSLFSPFVVRDDESILITVETLPDSDCFCNLISIQQPSCPYFDSVSSAVRFGIWQTMMNKTAVQIQSRDFPDGYLVVVVAAESDAFCLIKKEESKCGPRTKNLQKRIKITESVNTQSDTTWKAIVAILGIYAAVVIVSVGLSSILFRYDIDLFEGMKEMIAANKKKKKKSDIRSVLPFINQSFQGPDIELSTNIGIENSGHPEVEKQDSYIVEKEDVPDATAVNYSRLKASLFVSDLCEKLDCPDRSKSIYQKSNLFMGNFLLMSIFYSLAVLQLAFQSAAKQSSSGNNDICYYNSLCQKPLGPFLDFNHFFSNLGYVVFGVIFICIVYFKHERFEKCKENNSKDFVENQHGIPHQYGIYYTMGGALAMEGLMSACYHVCPTSISFQFDTTFMYLMAILMYIKLYQNRHPDISSNSLQAYLILGVALILEAISIYYSNTIFWVIFCTIYFFSIMLLAANIYNLGAVRHDRWLVVHVSRLFACELKKMFHKMQGRTVQVRPLLVLLAVTCGLNILLCIYYAVNATSNKSGASNYLLIMFMANMFVYLKYYMIMKFKSGERPVYQTWIYAGCAAVCALPAMYFFTKKEKNSGVSPAESRDINQHCILMDYFDGHDVWHFLGGAGVFFTFMFIFTIDEDLKYKKRNEIKVF